MEPALTSPTPDRLRSVLRLCQLVSPALPVGAYTYSRGLEYAVSAHWVRDEATAKDWILGQLENTLPCLDVPVFARIYVAWRDEDTASLTRWNSLLKASRESAELAAEDRHLGAALARVLTGLGVHVAEQYACVEDLGFAAVFSLACVRWHVPLEEAACGYLWTWTENQVTAAIKLIPLGQTAGQVILSQAVERIPGAVARGLTVDNEGIGASAPGLGIASALHETQYTRLFRS